jgi:hypothetical protein
MKCLTSEELAMLVEPLGIRRLPTNYLDVPKRESEVLIKAPPCPLRLERFAGRLSNFLGDGERILWLIDWETDPINQYVLFTAIRKGYGEMRSLIAAPGHLFANGEIDDAALLGGMSFLIVAFNWQAYLLSAGSADYILLGDSYLQFATNNSDKRRWLLELMRDFDLKQIKDVREAW